MTTIISSGDPLPEIVKSSDFWFSDGSIVLVVENNAFRVHESILSHHSGVFADMFSLPRPDQLDETEMLDGKPIVVLQDTIEDIIDVLSVLYQPL